MACVIGFTPEIPFECLAQLVTSFRTGSVSVETVNLALWCAGCLTSYLAGNKQTVGAEMGYEDLSSLSMDDLMDRLDNFVKTQQMPEHLPPAVVEGTGEQAEVKSTSYSIPSWVLPILLQLLQRWMVG